MEKMIINKGSRPFPDYSFSIDGDRVCNGKRYLGYVRRLKLLDLREK